MSDFSIPGVPGTSRYNTDEIIKGLMDIERIPLTRLEEKSTELEKAKSIWQDFNRKITKVKEAAKGLFGFENPFNEKEATTSDAGILTADVTREALERTDEIIVRSKAQADKFISQPIPDDVAVPSGTYSFTVGDSEIEFSFGGGTIRELIDRLNVRSKNLIKAQIIKNTPDSSVFVIESLKPGSANTLSFGDDNLDFWTQIGLLRRSDSAERSIVFDEELVRKLTAQNQAGPVSAESGVLTLPPGSTVTIPLSSPLKPETDILFEYELYVKNTAEEIPVPSPPPGPEIPELDPLKIDNLTIRGRESVVPLREWLAPDEPVHVDDLKVLSLKTSSGEKKLPDVADSSGFEKFSFPTKADGDTITAIVLRNYNTDRTISIRNMRFYDPDTRGKAVPLQVVTSASDSTIEYEGVDITRDKNDIDDILPGVTLHIKKASENSVQLEIRPNYEKIKDAIITFVHYYNTVLEDIAILTGKDEKIIEEITYYDDDQRSEAYENLGTFQGDMTFTQLKSTLQRLTMNPYTTSAGSNLSLLAQIGISTNAVTQGYDASKLRGYLEIDEKKLDSAIESSSKIIRELFGMDTDGDLIIDSGLAYEIDRYLNPMTQVGGIIALRLQNLDSQLSQNETKITGYEEKLAGKEQELRIEYGRMEGALNSLQGTSDALNNYFINNNKN